MKKTNVKVSSIVEYQLPEFVRVEYPLLPEFLKEYYRYTETNFGPSDIISNINDYIKLDSLSNIADVFYLYNDSYIVESVIKNATTLSNNESVVKIKTKTPHNLINGDFVDIIPYQEFSSELSDLIDFNTYGFAGRRFSITLDSNNPEYEFFLNDSTIGINDKNVINSNGVSLIVKSTIKSDQNQIVIYSKANNKKSLPIKYGLIQINNEIILFKDVDENVSTINVDGEEYSGIILLNCIRGFSGTTSLGKDTEDELIFEETLSAEHFVRSEVINLNSIFLKKFLQKIKYQFLPGFENRDLNPDLNESIFIKQSKDFYSSKGTEGSFKILFSVLYGEKVSVITPRDFLLEPSDAQYKVLRNLVVEPIEGNPEDLLNRTLFQDDVGFIRNARGTVSAVERIERSGRTYYVIGIDDGYERDINFRGTLFSSFSIHPKTYSIETIFPNSTTIEVDSTVSFPNSGNLVVNTIDPETQTKLIYNISYQSKTLNQFLGCKTIGSIIDNIRDTIYPNSEVFTDTYAYGFTGENNDKIAKVRISGVLSNFEQNEQTFLYESGNKIRVRSLGEESGRKKDNNWIYNIPITYDIDTAFVEDILDNSYRLTFADQHNFHKSDTFYIDQIPDNFLVVKSVPSKNSIVARLDSPVGTPDQFGRVVQLERYSITRLLSKGLFDNYPDLNIYNSNVQNTYLDKEKSLYIASPSLPSYSDISGGPSPLDIRDGSISGKFFFGKEFINNGQSDKLYSDGSIDYSYFTTYALDATNNLIVVNHGFFTGDEVVFRSEDPRNAPFPDGIYYVKEFRSEGDPYGIKLSSSRSNILNEKYVSPKIFPPSTVPSITIADCSIQYYSFSKIDFKSLDNFKPQIIGPQNIIRKISDPIQDTVVYDTLPGTTGIFLNGVEILNYKSQNSIFYGPIESVDVVSSGFGYDVINPPEFLIEDFGGAIVKYNAKSSIPLLYNDSPIKFGSVGGTIITYGGIGGEEIKLGERFLLLGKNKLYINQTGGNTLRINGLIVTVGGSGGTALSLGGEQGIDIRISDDFLTLGTLGSGCEIYPSINGKLEKVNIIYQGFNYIGTPKISIRGGGGTGALVEPIMESFEYEAPFYPQVGSMNIGNNTIGFATYHNFENYEEVIYISGISTTIYGLENRSRYIVYVEDEKTVKLYKSKEDAFVGISTVDIKAYSTGVHFLKSSKNKSRIGAVNVLSSGSGYKNKKTSTTPSNVNLVTNVITIPKHGYSSGDLIVHYSSGNLIGGISTNTSYYVTRIDDDNIKLSEIYTDQSYFEAPQDFLYQTKQYLNLTSVGTGIHYFNYDPIVISVQGFIGVSTSAGQDLNAKLQPVFRGEVDKIFVSNKGSGYGSPDILNYAKQPALNVVKGKNGQLIPIISSKDGSIVEVLVTNQGKNYVSIPDIIVRGDGNGAVLTPILKDGKIIEIKVIYGGLNYRQENTTIDIIDRGEGVKISTNIKTWRINLLKRYRLTNRETNDGGFVYSGLNSEYGLQYTHIYLPNKFRELIYNDYFEDKSTVVDIEADRSLEKRHSPIVGWAYDGNPIYGPYGYENAESGVIRALRSGYSLFEGLERVDGPPLSLYPNGFFVEDYEYKVVNSGDLDESNGRYCKTPEFPNGTYAYFCTIDTTQPLQDGFGYPSAFPYVIGNKYKSKPIEFNFDAKSNQNDIDINKTGWYRNTSPYNINGSKNSRYQYLLIPNKIKDPISQIKYASYGEIEFVDVVVGGQDYKIGDKIKFENGDIIGQNATAEVSEISGVDVRSVSVARSTFENVEFGKFGNGTELIGFTNTPHGYTSGDIVSISTPIERVVFKDINFYVNNLFLTKSVRLQSQTGIITYFEVSGDLNYPTIRENDIYYIVDPGSTSNSREEIKILNIDKKNNIVRVSRSNNGYVGLATYPSGTRLTEKSRKFNSNLGIQTYYNFNVNYDYYFDATEVVGLGTKFGTGITSTIYFNYPKSGITSLSIPTRTIYLKDHGFNTNDPLKYSSDGFISVSRSNNISNTFIVPQNSIVYAIKINDDLIGISTGKVGFGSTGILSSIGTNIDPLLCFNYAEGNCKFKTLKQNVLTAKVSQSIVTVSTSSTHGLLNNDVVDIKINPLNTKTVFIEYNNQARILIANPIEFQDTDVNLDENLFSINNHQYKTGDKVLYKSETPILGLEDNEIYYVVVTDRNNFGLCNSLFESKQEFPKFLSLNSSTDGKFYQINPEIQVIKGQNVVFDISHNSLSFTQGSSTQRIPSFTFDLYQDSNFNHKYISSGKTNIFDVSKTGIIGTSGAKLTLIISADTPSSLFYKLTPLNINGNPPEKLGIFIDSEQSNNNKITVTSSKYDGKYPIFDPIERDPTLPPFEFSEFKYQIPRDPESEFYDNENSIISYNTISKNAFGSIVKASVKNKGRYFYRLPTNTLIKSSNGTGAIVSANSTNIGQIKSVNIKDIGFDYPSDLSIRAIAKLPTIYKVEPLYSIEKITIISNGINYLTAPNIDVIDAKTKELITDLVLSYNLGDNFVTIVRNTKNLSNVVPRLVPVNNSNGIPLLLNQGNPIILNLNTNSEPEEVQLANDFAQLDLEDPDIDSLYSNLLSASPTRVQSLPLTNLPTIQVFLKTEYSSILDFPFELGDFVFIEDVITKEETNGGSSKGFNSDANGYSFYKIVKVDPNIGGSGASITLDFDGYVDENVQDPENSDSYKVDEILSEASRVVPVKYFPIYSVVLQKNNFIQDEELITEDGTSIGIVEQWDSSNDYLKIAETVVFNVGDTIIGQTSKTKAILLKKIDFDAGYNISDSSVVSIGWDLDTGKLNFDLQRIHDNDYYQYFSYALKSKVPIDKWNDDVGSLNHTAGFKRFSELELESTPINYSGITTSQEAISFGISDIISEVSVNCVYDFDLVREVTFGNPLKSNEIIFNSRILQDYIESISNRVLYIDDISRNFNALPRETNFSVVARSDSTKIRSKKSFFYIQDRRFTDDRQMQILTTIHDDENVYVGQYGRLETKYDMAYFESVIIGDSQVLQFYPARDEVNNFLIDFVVFELTDDPTELEEVSFGDISYVYNQIGVLTSGTNQGVGTTVVGIGSTYRSSKILLQVSSENRDYFEFNEISVIHDDSGNVALSEYGELTTSNLENETVLGICSYSSEMSSDGTTLNIIMTPYENLTQSYDIKTITTSVSNEIISSTPSSLSFETGQVTSFTISGISTEIPEPIVATQFSQQYKCSYMFVNVIGIQTGLITPYNVGIRDHGVSDWYAFEDTTVRYSAIYPETQIFEVTPEGYVSTILTTSSTNPQSGSIGITSGYRYFGSKGVHFMSEGSQHSIAPVSYASTTFGHFIADRGFTPGITTFFVYSPFESTEVRLYDNSPNGIAGIASTSIFLNSYQSGIITTSSLSSWVFFDSDSPVIMTVLGPGAPNGNDKAILSPSITGIGTINYKYYPNSLIIPSTERQRTAYNTFPSGSSAGITTSGVYDSLPVIAIRQSDGAGSDLVHGILLDNLSDTYSWGNTLSDYVIAAPYPNTYVNVSYWNGSLWILGESHDLSGGTFDNPKITQRDGTTGFGTWGAFMDGLAVNLGSGSTIWKFESNQPFALIVNDTDNDEEVLLGFSSARSIRPINKEYKASEIQLTSNTVNSYISEYGVVKISPSVGIGTVGTGSFSSRLIGGNTQLLFTPSPLIEYTINAFQINVGRL
jgi:hypothetical protein